MAFLVFLLLDFYLLNKCFINKNRESLLKAANTSLNSKVVSQNSAELSPIAVDAVMKVIDPARENNVNLKDIKIIKKLGGTVDDTELVDGLVFEQKAAGNTKKIEKAKIGLIQFCVSPPKTDMDNQVGKTLQCRLQTNNNFPSFKQFL